MIRGFARTAGIGRLSWVVFAIVTCTALCASAAWKPADGPLMTRWAKEVSPENAHPEYPRPQMVRQDWLNLNGL